MGGQDGPESTAEFRIQDSKDRAALFHKEYNHQRTLEQIESTAHVHRMFKKKFLMNCWHINNAENDSMWRLYLKSNEGVAIKTTTRKLLDSFNSTNETVLCSKIRYLDFEKDSWYHPIDYPRNAYNFFTPLIHKRIEFQQEAEIRLMHEIRGERDNDIDQFWAQQANEKGLNINVDVETLIEEVYSPPTSDDRQVEKIRSIISQKGFRFEVKRSILSNEPYY